MYQSAITRQICDHAKAGCSGLPRLRPPRFGFVPPLPRIAPLCRGPKTSTEMYPSARISLQLGTVLHPQTRYDSARGSCSEFMLTQYCMVFVASGTTAATRTAAPASSRPGHSTASSCLRPSSAPTGCTAARRRPWTFSGAENVILPGRLLVPVPLLLLLLYTGFFELGQDLAMERCIMLAVTLP